MAKKVANGVNKRKSRRRDEDLNLDSDFGKSQNFSSSDRNFSTGLNDRSQIIREWINNPAVRYVAGGIAAAVLSRLAQNMSEKYPELSRFLKENIDNFEGKLGQYRGGFEGDRESRA